MKAIELIPSGPISGEALKRHKLRVEKSKERLKKMKEDYDNGRFDHIISQL